MSAERGAWAAPAFSGGAVPGFLVWKNVKFMGNSMWKSVRSCHEILWKNDRFALKQYWKPQAAGDWNLTPNLSVEKFSF